MNFSEIFSVVLSMQMDLNGGGVIGGSFPLSNKTKGIIYASIIIDCNYKIAN